jgi:hypothetical protein
VDVALSRRALIGVAIAGALLAPPPGRAAAEPDAASARAFVEKLYSAYHGDGPDYLGRLRSRVFSPRMVALLRRDEKLTPKGDVGALDGDPICDCQDFDINRVEVKLGPIRGGRTVADVRFLNFKDWQTVRLDLIAMGAGWRIDNIHTASTPDLAAYLQKHAGGR